MATVLAISLPPSFCWLLLAILTRFPLVRVHDDVTDVQRKKKRDGPGDLENFGIPSVSSRVACLVLSYVLINSRENIPTRLQQFSCASPSRICCLPPTEIGERTLYCLDLSSEDTIAWIF